MACEGKVKGSGVFGRVEFVYVAVNIGFER